MGYPKFIKTKKVLRVIFLVGDTKIVHNINDWINEGMRKGMK